MCPSILLEDLYFSKMPPRHRAAFSPAMTGIESETTSHASGTKETARGRHSARLRGRRGGRRSEVTGMRREHCLVPKEGSLAFPSHLGLPGGSRGVGRIRRRRDEQITKYCGIWLAIVWRRGPSFAQINEQNQTVFVDSL